MANKIYNYKARNELGKVVKGKIEAPDRDAAFLKLRKQFPSVIDIVEPSALDNIGSIELTKYKVKPQKMALMCSQFGIILKSGTPVPTAAELIAGQEVKDKKLRNILLDVAKDLQAGKGLASAFEKHAKDAMPITFYETIRAGEAAGTLEESFLSLSKYFDDQAKTGSKIKSALAYPAFVMSIAVVVVFVIMTFVIPKLTQTFVEAGSDLPAMTRFLVSSSEFMGKYWWLFVIAVIVLIIAYKVVCHNPAGKAEVDRIKTKMPIFGNIIILSSSAQFANTLTMLLKSGLVMTEAIQTTARTITNKYFSDATANLSEAISKGKSLGKTMAKHDCFPPILTQMTAIGEDTGELEETLNMIGEYYVNESDRAVKSLTAKLEPALLVFMALIVGFIVIAIYLPMFEVYNTF